MPASNKIHELALINKIFYWMENKSRSPNSLESMGFQRISNFQKRKKLSDPNAIFIQFLVLKPFSQNKKDKKTRKNYSYEARFM